MKHTYNITGMHCQSCVAKITSAFQGIEGLKNVEIDFERAQATITTDKHVSLKVLNEALKPLEKYELKEVSTPAPTLEKEENLTPLFIIVGYLTGGVLLRAMIAGDFSVHSLMTNFMGGFFVVFSLFKMIDLKGFAEGYATYDILARRSALYAKTYPFIELALGVLYFAGLFPVTTNIVTATLMFIGAIGVAKALSEKRSIQCACLGTALKLPMTKVTLVEDLLMGVMAIAMLLL